jgi:hypothetical protein
MNWDVPESPVLAEIFAVPPFFVEFTVGKISKFCRGI